MEMRGRGKVSDQRKRRRQRLRVRPKRQDKEVQLYDGNWSYYPSAYCGIHGAYLSQGLIDTHRCKQRNCSGLKWLGDDD